MTERACWPILQLFKPACAVGTELLVLPISMLAVTIIDVAFSQVLEVMLQATASNSRLLYKLELAMCTCKRL